MLEGILSFLYSTCEYIQGILIFCIFAKIAKWDITGWVETHSYKFIILGGIVFFFAGIVVRIFQQ